MRFSLSVVFFLLFLVVVSAYVYLVPSSGPKPGSVSKPDLNSRLLQLEDNDEITTLEIENVSEKEKIIFVKEERRWLLREPVQGAADKLLVDGLTAALTLSSTARRLTPESGWNEYGLENPPLKVGVATRKHQEIKRLYFGDKSPVGDFVFARWQNEAEYFLLDPNLMKAFQRSAYSFREKKIFHQPLKQLSTIRIQNESEVYEVNRQDSGWVWVEPIEFIGKPITPGDADLVVNMMRGLYIKDFLGAETDAAEKGFGMLGPETVLEMKSIENDVSEVLHLGEELPVRDAFYARKNEESEVFLVARDKIGEVFALFRSLASARLNGVSPSAGSSESSLPDASGV